MRCSLRFSFVYNCNYDCIQSYSFKAFKKAFQVDLQNLAESWVRCANLNRVEFAIDRPTFHVQPRSTARPIFVDQARKTATRSLSCFSSPNLSGHLLRSHTTARVTEYSCDSGFHRKAKEQAHSSDHQFHSTAMGTVALAQTSAGRRPPGVARSRARIRRWRRWRTAAPVKYAVALQIFGGICMQLQFKQL